MASRTDRPSGDAGSGPVDRTLLVGTALHAGGPVRVELVRRSGPLVLVQRGRRVPLRDLHVTRADGGVGVADDAGAVRLDLVEHLMAAFAGLGVREGVEIVTEDSELPLLDGGARAWALALRTIGAREGAPPRLHVAQDAVLRDGAAEIRFFAPRAAEVEVEVEVDFPAPIGRGAAAWRGDADDFVDCIAPARTFGWIGDHARLLAAGRARGVDLASVLVLDERGAVPGCRPPELGEAARHKLLDLVGDLALYGGPPFGRVHATRPVHAATHTLVTEAKHAGILVAHAATDGSSPSGARRFAG